MYTGCPNKNGANFRITKTGRKKIPKKTYFRRNTAY